MLFLAPLLGQPVYGKTGELIGKLDDLIVRIGEATYPPISGMVVRTNWRHFFVPARQLAELKGVVRLHSSTVNMQPFQRRNDEVVLSRDVLDHQIIDITGRRLVRVNDVQLARVEATYHVVGVDISPQALLRRLSPRALAGRIVGRQIIDWAEVQYLASAAPVQLKVSYDRLQALHPADLARIVDALSFHESAEVVAALDDETAAETLEEVSDERVADLLEGMDQERAADILEEMDPGAAADALEDLDDDVAEQLLARMEPEDAADVQTSLAYDEDSVGRIMIPDLVRVAESATVGDAITVIRALAEVPDPLLAIYVVAVDDDTRLRGLVRLRTLIVADPQTPVVEVMDDDLPTVHPSAPATDAARVLALYNLLAVPVLDDDERLVGIVTVDDALAVLLPGIWQKRRARTFGREVPR